MNAEAFLDLIRAVILLAILLNMFYLSKAERPSIRLIFFSLAVVSIMFSDFYWFAYDVMYSEVRMPFAANEIAEGASFLLLGSSLNSGKSLHITAKKEELISAALFAAANTALWIGWSGEWMQDILTGAVFTYFLCALFGQFREEGTFSKSKQIMLGVLSLILLTVQGATFISPEPLRRLLDMLCYALLFLVALVMLFRILSSLGKNGHKMSVSYTFAYFAWVITTMYMSEGVFHTAALALTVTAFPLMFVSLKKEEKLS